MLTLINTSYVIIYNSQNWQNIADSSKESTLTILKNFYCISYWNTMWFILVSGCITFIMLSLATTLSLTFLKNQAQLSEYECGFEPFDNATRTPFEVHFYVVGILFLIFDVEIALLYPWIFSLQETCVSKFFFGYIFIIILGIGFGYELKMNILKWKQEPILIGDKEFFFLRKKHWNQKSIFLFCGTEQNFRKGKPKEWYFNQSIGGGRGGHVHWIGTPDYNNIHPLKQKWKSYRLDILCKLEEYDKNCWLEGKKIDWEKRPSPQSCWCLKCQMRELK